MSAVVASSNNYFVPKKALQINLNALSNKDYLDIVSYGSAKVYVYMRDVVDENGNNLGRDEDGNNKCWNLEVAPTYFEDTDARWLYLAVARNGQRAILAWPKVQVDVYGKTYGASEGSEEQVLPATYFYIMLGRISSSADGAFRTWLKAIDYGILETDAGREQNVAGNYLRKDKDDATNFALTIAIAKIKSYLQLGGVGLRNVLVTAKEWAESVFNDETIGTTGWIKKHFLTKSANDSTTYNLGVGGLSSTGDVTAAENVKGKNISATNNVSANNNITAGNNVSASGSVFTDSIKAKNATDAAGNRNPIRIGSDMVFGVQDTTQDYVANTSGCKIFWTGSGWRIDTDYLSVNKKMYAKEIEVQKVTHVGGEQLLTAANCIADFVTPIKMGDNVLAYKVYFRAEDGDGRKVTNDWVVGDQAYCQTFNINEGVTQDFSNKYYWRLVVSRGTAYMDANGNEVVMSGDDIPEGSELFNYIVLSNLSGEYDENSLMAIDVNDGRSDAPEVGDNIIQFGFNQQRSEDPTDTETAKSRWGATLISGAGLYARAIIMWELICGFVIPSPRVYMSPDRVDLKVNSLSIIVGEGDERKEESVKDYIMGSIDGRIIINGDDANAPISPATNTTPQIQQILQAVFGDNEHSIDDLVGAVYITTEKMFYMLTYNSTTNTYTWLDDTDGTLKALYDNYGTIREDVDNILDDNVVTVDEKISLVKDLKIITDTKTSIIDDDESGYGAILGTAASDDRYEVDEEYTSVVDNLFDAIEGVTNAFDTVNTYLQFLTKSTTWSSFISLPTAPVSDASASDDFTASFTRTQLNDAIANFYKAQLQCQIAFENFQINYISQSAIAQAKTDVESYVRTYVSNEISSLTGKALNDTIEEQITYYYNNHTVDGTNTIASKLTAYSNSIAALVQSVEGNTSSISGLRTTVNSLFVGNERITFDETTNKYTISFSGLVTENGFASLFAAQKDATGITSRLAEVSTFITNTGLSFTDIYGKIGNIEAGTSIASISADKVIISSGEHEENDGSFSYNFYLDADGNVIMKDLWAKNITVEGVINNLINTVADTDLIPYELDGNGNNTKDALDILCLGDVISLDSCNDRNIHLPYYINESLNERTPTLYGGNQHLITPTELKQLIGRKITIFINAEGHYLKGCHYFELYTNAQENGVKPLANGTPLFEAPADNEDWGVMVSPNTIVHLEFRVAHFRTASGTIYPGYVWCMTSAQDNGTTLDTDENWLDVDEI